MTTSDDHGQVTDTRRLPSPDRHSAPTPLDVRQAKFGSAIKGYDKSEVNAFLLDRANHQRKTGELKGRTRDFLEIDWQGHRIWGVTAAIIANLSRRLAWERA